MRADSGYLTIGTAPPSPFPEEPPPQTAIPNNFAGRTSSPDRAIRNEAWGEANGPAKFQAELQRLSGVPRQEEPYNFVEMKIVRDPHSAAKVWFQRDASRTLARYTSDPLFRPRQGGVNSQEERRLRDYWVQKAAELRVINTVSVNPIGGTVELGVSVEEAEFRKTAAERGWKIGPEVKMVFPPARPPEFADPSLSKLVRVFARETKAEGIQLEAATQGRIILDDGCFRLPSGNAGKRGALVMFGRQTKLATDEQGYLVILSASGRRYRIGEAGIWPGPNGVDPNDAALARLHEACGSEPVINVAEPESERLSSLPHAQWLVDYSRAHSLPYRATLGTKSRCA